MRKLFYAIKNAFSEFSNDRCMSSGAAIAYYSIFALPPLLVIVFVIAGYAGVTEQQINEVLKKQLGLPTDVAQSASSQQDGQNAQNGASSEQAANAGKGSSSSGTSKSSSSGTSNTSLGSVAERAKPGEFAGIGMAGRVVSIVLLVFTATGLFAQLQTALNRAWDVEPDPERGGVKRFIVKRLFSLGMIIVFAFLLMISLVVSTLIDQIIGYVQGTTPDMMVRVLSIVLDNLATFILAMLLFAAMFKILPDADMAWRDTLVGAAMTALLFLIGKSLIAWYLQSSNVGATWGGAAASLIAILAWLYYTSLIVLFGAELTQVWAKTFGSGIRASDGAVRVFEEKRYER